MRYLLVALLVSLGLQAQKIEFREISFNEGLEAAAEEGKPIFIDAFTTWCGPCKWMSANIFTDKSVAEYYNANYVCLKIDMEKGEGLDIAKKYQVRAYPTLLYLDEKGERLLVKVGASREPQGYIDAGEQAKDPQRNLPYLLANVDENMKNPSFMYDYIMTVSAANMMPEGTVDRYFEQYRIDDWADEENWEIITNAVSNIESRTFKSLATNAELINTLRPEDGMAYIEQTLFYGLANKLYRARNEESMAQYQSLKEEYLNEEFPASEKLSFRLDLVLYEKNKDYESYGTSALENVKLHFWEDANELNNVSWTVYENVEDPAILKAALQWAKRAVELAPEHHIMDTYAHLLAANKQNKKALEVELKALEMAQKDGASTKSYSEFIAELQGAL